ncbi:MAG: NUDIX hydrolase [Ornithinimicrobium sp.]
MPDTAVGRMDSLWHSGRMNPWTLKPSGPGVAELMWTVDDPWWLDAQAPTALAEFLTQGYADGLHRVEAQVPRDHRELRQALQRAGLRPEGVARGRHLDASGVPVDVLRLARLADDPLPGTRQAFLAMLNATLPTKRVIAQGLIRNDRGDVLMCQLTYKQEWDLPGGVVDPHESPAGALAREITEELGVEVQAGSLLAIDWLPPYRQWDDAVLLVFDLGVHPDLPARARLQPTEIAGLHWCDTPEVQRRAAPYVARLLAQLRSAVASDPSAPEGATEGPVYLEDGLPYEFQG